MNWRMAISSPVFGVAVTVIAYVGALWLYRRVRWLHPLLVCSAGLVLLLVLLDLPYADYRRGGDVLIFFLQPATVALGVPLYKHARAIRRAAPAIVAAVGAGAVVGLAGSAGFVWLLGGSGELMRSAMPKSATTPISVELSRLIGGAPELTAVLTVLTGLVGSVVGPWLLKRCGIRADISIGAAVGTSSHGIGTARVLNDSERQGAVSALCMALCGIATSLFAIPVYYWLR